MLSSSFSTLGTETSPACKMAATPTCWKSWITCGFGSGTRSGMWVSASTPRVVMRLARYLMVGEGTMHLAIHGTHHDLSNNLQNCSSASPCCDSQTKVAKRCEGGSRHCPHGRKV